MPQAAVPAVAFDAALISRLDRPGPRDTVHSTADRFGDDFGYPDYLQALASLPTHGSRHPLSLYECIPFCDKVCCYGAFNKIVTRDRNKAVTYLG